MKITVISVAEAEERFGPNRVANECPLVAAIGVSVTHDWTQKLPGREVTLFVHMVAPPTDACSPVHSDLSEKGLSDGEHGAVVFLFERAGPDEASPVRRVASIAEGCCGAELEWGEITWCHLDIRWHNQVKFLLDGEEYFGELLRRLKEVRDAPADPTRTYVRLAYWSFDPVMTLTYDLSDPEKAAYKQVEETYDKAKAAYDPLLAHCLRCVSVCETADRDNREKESSDSAKKLAEAEAALKKAEEALVAPKQVLDAAAIPWEPQTLLGHLRKVAATHPVDLLVWEPAVLKGAPKFVHDNTQYLRDLKHRLREKPCDKITLLTHNHGATKPTLSMHQKVAIFSVDGQLSVLVGGFNCEKQYRDDRSHGRAQFGHSHHDTALWVKGPAAADVEAEYVRVWAAALAAYWSNPANAAARKAVLQPKSEQYQNQQPGCPVPLGVSPLVTDSVAGIRTLRAKLLELISGAKEYLYFEGYQLHYPAFIAAAEALVKKEGGPSLCVVLPHPVCDGHGPDSFMSRIAFTRLLFADRGTTGWTGKSIVNQPTMGGFWSENVSTDGVQIGAKDGWSLDAPVKGFFESSCLKKGNEQFPLKDIERFTRAEGVPRAAFYFPMVGPSGVYVHSKLFLCDDAHLVIGSANFGARSQEWDSELSLHVEVHPASIQFLHDVKGRLLGHFGVGGMAQLPRALWEGSRVDTASGGLALLRLQPSQMANTATFKGGWWADYTYY